LTATEEKRNYQVVKSAACQGRRPGCVLPVLHQASMSRTWGSCEEPTAVTIRVPSLQWYLARRRESRNAQEEAVLNVFTFLPKVLVSKKARRTFRRILLGKGRGTWSKELIVRLRTLARISVAARPTCCISKRLAQRKVPFCKEMIVLYYDEAFQCCDNLTVQEKSNISYCFAGFEAGHGNQKINAAYLSGSKLMLSKTWL